MSVPTSNLYDFIHQVLENNFWIRYFYPFGCKELSNLIDLHTEQTYLSDFSDAKKICKNIVPRHQWLHGVVRNYQPIVCCHDQEPLFYELYTDQNLHQNYKSKYSIDAGKNLRYSLPSHTHTKWILLHSEVNSQEVDKYNNSNYFVCAYWWSHAALSLDWFRFAEYDTRLKYKNNNEKTFLVYTRDTGGSRTYRKQFLTQLEEDKTLFSRCQIGSFNKTQEVSSDSSAEYNHNDFTSTDISIVLETVFDQRIHLTEKTLRPIALGHPFLLACGAGSLDYLKKYGFKTFDPYINESYDKIEDDSQRLQAILQEMQRINNLDADKRNSIVQQCRAIAQYNKNVFFSKRFFQQIKEELKTNVFQAYSSFENNLFDYDHFLQRRQELLNKKIPDKTYAEDVIIRKCNLALFNYLKRGGTLENYVPPFKE